MKPSPITYFILVRPVGSYTWTLHTFAGGTPWRDGSIDIANKTAIGLVEHAHAKLCAIVVPVTTPPDVDTRQYAQLGDGDTLYMPNEPVLVSKRTGEGVV